MKDEDQVREEERERKTPGTTQVYRYEKRKGREKYQVQHRYTGVR